NDHSHSIDAMVEEFPDLQAVINGMKKDLRFGYAAGEEDAAIGYVYGRSESELLLACSYASRRCLGFYNMKGKRLELAEVNPEKDGDSVSWLVEAFREGILYTKPKIISTVSKADLDARYAIDESGFDVMSVVGEGLASFIRNKIRIDSGDHNKEVHYTTRDLKRSILHCAGLLTDGRIHYVYPPKDDSGENIPADRIKGALLLACIGEIGIKEKMLVSYSNDHPNMIRVCKNVPWKSNRSEWWADVKNSFRIIEIPNMATEDDAAAIVPSLFPPAGVRFEGLSDGFTGGDVTVVLRHDDTYYSGADIEPMEHVYRHIPLLVVFEGKLWGKVVHPFCRDLRAGVCCKDGFLYATNEGAFFRMRSGKGAVLTKAPNVCGLKYLPDENMIQVFLFKDLRQYEYNQHHDTCGYMYEEWRNSYHTDVEIKSYNYDGIVRQLS
ncbi:MAG: hypothetical protein IKM88_07030, partial [Lachnospiraceae bacterium]|nr:hypothetical protein [Lachnospiraceae bacterium]